MPREASIPEGCARRMRASVIGSDHRDMALHLGDSAAHAHL